MEETMVNDTSVQHNTIETQAVGNAITVIGTAKA